MLITQRAAIEQAYRRHEDNLERPTGLYGHDWGHHDWNMVIAGALPGTITTLAAMSGGGKTGSLIQVMEAAGTVVNGSRAEVLFFSWEMSARGNVERYICHKAGLTMQEYRYAKNLSEGDKDLIIRAYSKGKNLPVHYHQTSTDIDTVLNICAEHYKMIRAKEIEEGVKIQLIVIVDYVSMAKAKQKSYGSKTYDVGDFMQTFKQEANLKGYCGLFLAQIRRDAEGEPNASQIQDSGSYYQNSDNMILMYRPEAAFIKEIRDPVTDQMVSSANRVLWRFVKTREGAPQDILGHCDIKHFRFWHRHHQWGYDYTKLYENEEFWKQQYGL